MVIAGDFDVDQLSSNCNGSKLKRIYQAFNFQNGIHNHSGFDLNKSLA